MLNDQLHGFYRSTYKDEAGVSHTIAATQFESTDARRGFPCWDEPAFKAVFGVSLVVPEGLAAVSNAAIVSESPAGAGKKVVAFADTIRMSTYLVAFVVGELEATDPVMVGRTPLRVWCVPAKKRLARFAAAIGAFSLEFFERYYGLPYPGDKLDLLAIPDFAAGAMENLGAITFRETALLVDEAAASHAELERVADVVAHEIAHMWFGDLVTMAWWNGIWLNEAFATFMELLAVDAWKPEWKRWVTFGASRAAAMGVDGLAGHAPHRVRGARAARLRGHVRSADLREGRVGAAHARAAPRARMSSAMACACIWTGIASPTPRPPISGRRSGTRPDSPSRRSWTAGSSDLAIPLVTVEPDGQGLRLAQRRFTYLEGAGEGQWRVPVLLRASVKKGIVEKHLLLEGRDVAVPLPAAADWVVVNAGGHGFYRVRYARRFSRSSSAPWRGSSRSTGSISSAIASRSRSRGPCPRPEYLDLTARFMTETDRNVWTVLAGSFAYVGRVIAPEIRPGLAALVRHRVAPAFERLGWEPEPGESELQRQLRGELLRLLGTFGDDPATQERARELYARHRDDEMAVDPNVLPALISIVAWTGGEEQYACVPGALQERSHPAGGTAVSLCPGRLPPAGAAAAGRSISPSSGRCGARTRRSCVRALLASVHGRGLAWEFVKEHWEAMARQYPGSAYRRMWEGVTALISADWERDVRDFFSSRGIVLGGKALSQYLEQLHVAVASGARGGLAAYLGRHGGERPVQQQLGCEAGTCMAARGITGVPATVGENSAGVGARVDSSRPGGRRTN